jgi:hypothetical protein
MALSGCREKTRQVSYDKILPILTALIAIWEENHAKKCL